MAAPSWLADSFAAVTIATAAYCAGRLLLSWLRRRPTDHQVDLAHVLMGAAMAGMLVPGLRVFWTGGWEIVFSAGAVLFGWRMIGDTRSRAETAHRSGHHLQHVLACVAMVYMLAAAAGKAGSGATAGMAAGTGHVPTLALVLALSLLGYVVWTADRITSLAPVTWLAAGRMPAPAGARAGGAELPAGAPGSTAESEFSADEQAIPAGPVRRPPLSPRLAACCEIAMGVTMAYMLVTML